MLTYPEIDPNIFSIGFLTIRWYSVTYLVAFAVGWWLATRRANRPNSGWKADEVGDVVFYIALGVILGGRIGSVVFYNFNGWMQDPLLLFRIWEGGMSFHGGFIGVVVAFWLYGRHTGRSFFQVSDFLAPMFPFGLGAGRVGNFINGELWGRVTDVPWGMVFPHVDNQPRHPNQIYQIIGEGILLFALVWFYSRKPRPTMAVSGLFVLAYGVYRFMIEFVREPDADLGFIAFDWLTMGQILSLPMAIIGATMMWLAHRPGNRQGNTPGNTPGNTSGNLPGKLSSKQSGKKPGKRSGKRSGKGA